MSPFPIIIIAELQRPGQWRLPIYNHHHGPGGTAYKAGESGGGPATHVKSCIAVYGLDPICGRLYKAVDWSLVVCSP